MSTARDRLYRRHRFPPEIISYAVWLYFRFPLSLRMVEEMLAARGICVSYETVRQWAIKFGETFSGQIRQRAPSRGDKWHLDEVAISIAGQPYWLWRAVDQNGFVLDVLVQRRRDTQAAIVLACLLQRSSAIQSVGGYLRELTRKARAGEFSLGAVLMAQINARTRERRTA
jgi:putative transposase